MEPPGATPIKSVTETDRILIDELLMLEQAMERNYQWVYDLIAPFLGRSLLEVGSGVGVLSRYLVEHGAPIVLSDHHASYLSYLRSRFEGRPNVSFQVLDLNDEVYDLGGRTIDTVVCLNVLEHIEDDQSVLCRFARLLPPRGRLVLQIPNYPALFGSLDETYGHFRRYTRAIISQRLVAAGFSVQAIRNFNPLAVLGWLLFGRLLRAPRFNVRSARFFNAIVPVVRRLEFLSRWGGLALIVCAERTASR